MQLRRPKKSELLSTTSFGTWITIPHPAVAELLARAGFDWLNIDLEHSAISLESAAELIRTIDLAGLRAFVRVGSHDPNVIKRVMDAGAHGIIASTVNTPEQAAAIVGAVRYPGIGTRGVGLSRAQGYGDEFDTYYEWVNKESIVFVQIEHIEAVRNLRAILEVPGVDGFVIGPYDLSASLGAPGDFHHSKMKEALLEVKSVQEKLNSVAGVHIVHPNPKDALQKIQEGYRFIGFGVDFLFLQNSAREALKELKSKITTSI
jgi:2-keto-3-deoxy-L-rhamnonate aldolase RhmA